MTHRDLAREHTNRRRVVAVMAELIACEVNSSTYPSAAANRLARDVDAIPGRYAALLAQQDADRRRRVMRGRRR